MIGVGLWHFWRDADNEVDFCDFFAELGIGDWVEGCGGGSAGLGVAYGAVDAVAIVAVFFLCDENLRGEGIFALNADFDMDVWSSAGVGDGLDGAEVEFACGAGGEAPESLEVLIFFIFVACAGVEVGAAIIDLPDFDAGVGDRFARSVENPAGEVESSQWSSRWISWVDDAEPVAVERYASLGECLRPTFCPMRW